MPSLAASSSAASGRRSVKAKRPPHRVSSLTYPPSAGENVDDDGQESLAAATPVADASTKDNGRSEHVAAPLEVGSDPRGGLVQRGSSAQRKVATRRKHAAPQPPPPAPPLKSRRRTSASKLGRRNRGGSSAARTAARGDEKLEGRRARQQHRRHSESSPPRRSPTPREAALTLQRFVRCRVLLGRTLVHAGELAKRVRRQLTRENRLQELRVRLAKRTLAAFFQLAAEVTRGRRQAANAGAGGPLGFHAADPSATGSATSPNSSSIVAMALHRERERQIVEAAAYAKQSTRFVERMFTLRMQRRATRVIEAAWVKSARYRKLCAESTWRGAERVLAEQEVVERRDLVRRHVLFLVHTHQTCYNDPAVIAARSGTRTGWTAFLATESNNNDTRSTAFGGVDGGGDSARTDDGTPCSSAAPPTPQPDDAEADVLRYERRLFFSKEERELLRELDLLDVEPAEMRRKRELDSDPASEAAAWVDNAEQVKLFDRILRGRVSATRGAGSFPAPSGPPATRGAAGLAVVEAGRHHGGGCNGRAWWPLASEAAPASVRDRAAAVCRATAEGSSARLPSLLLRTLKEKGHLDFSTPLCAGEWGGWAGGSAGLLLHSSDSNESGEDSDDGSGGGGSSQLPSGRTTAERRVNVPPGMADTSLRRAEIADDVASSHNSVNDSINGGQFGAVAVPPRLQSSLLYKTYTTFAACRADAGGAPDLCGDGDRVSSPTSPPLLRGSAVPIGESAAALRVSGRCDWSSESYLNPLSRPGEWTNPSGRRRQSESSDTGTSSDASARTVERDAPATGRTYCGIETHLKGAGQDRGVETRLHDLVLAAVGVRARDSTAN